MEPLQKAIELFETQKAFADALGVTTQTVNNWKSRGVPPRIAKNIEEVTDGQVSRRELAPDVFS